jgi:hypothetical protein
MRLCYLEALREKNYIAIILIGNLKHKKTILIFLQNE